MKGRLIEPYRAMHTDECRKVPGKVESPEKEK